MIPTRKIYEKERRVFLCLINAVKSLCARTQELVEEVQRLRDENNRRNRRTGQAKNQGAESPRGYLRGFGTTREQGAPESKQAAANQIKKLLRDILEISLNALKHLAEKNKTVAELSTETETQHHLLRQEEHSWTTSALLCAYFAPVLPKRYEQLSQQGEIALRKALLCGVALRDQDRAIDLYQEYQETKERDGIGWVPEAATEQCWQRVLSLSARDEAA